MDDTELKIRKLAKSVYWQNLYSASKTIQGVHLFNNDTNYTSLQLKFLYWLSVYEMLYEELAQHKDEYLTEKVIEDDIRTNAYLLYRNKKYDHMWKKMRLDEKMSEHKNKHPKKHLSGEMNLIEVDMRK